MSKRGRRIFASERGYPTCPNCKQTNYVYHYDANGSTPVWNGLSAALRGGREANLWTRKGRIYGGPKFKRKWKGNAPDPVRVNEKNWKIVRVGPALYIACAHKFHEEKP